MKSFIVTNYTYFIQAIIIFFAPIKGIIILVALSTVLDTCFGVWKAKQLRQGVTSKNFRHGLVPKITSYVGATMLVYASDYFIINELTKMMVSVEFLFTKLIALVLISIEVKSMDESFEKVKGYSFLNKAIDLIIKAKNIKKEL
jgi:hypothetical protein